MLSTPVSACMGVGLALRTSFCRLEVNLTHPLSMIAGDLLGPKVQIGVGMSFL